MKGSSWFGPAKIPKPRGARKIIVIGLGPIEHRRKMDAERSKRWRRNNPEKVKKIDAKNHKRRADLYRKGGRYYEERRNDPTFKSRMAAYQREYRKNG